VLCDVIEFTGPASGRFLPMDVEANPIIRRLKSEASMGVDNRLSC
jgi:hypothetical protein